MVELTALAESLECFCFGLAYGLAMHAFNAIEINAHVVHIHLQLA